nr:12305_t:CDS:10 [Entrophospora candida]
MTSVKILVTGSANGKFHELFSGITKFNAKYGPFDLLLCVGDLFGENTDEIDSLLDGSIKVPITTYFMYGQHELPKVVKERVENNNGELCQSLFYLGEKGSINTTEGVKIAFVSGPLGSLISNLPKEADILLTYEWPKSITRHSPKSVNVPLDSCGSEFVDHIAATVKPRYHFAASANTFFQREPYQNPLSPSQISVDDDTQQKFGTPTWFVGIADVGNSKKEKWYFGFNIVPFVHLPAASLTLPPDKMTQSPYVNKSDKKRGYNDGFGDNNYFWNAGDSSGPSKKRGKQNPQGPPPENYICNRCNVPGHWVHDCPEKKKACAKCRETGHHAKDCPQKSSASKTEATTAEGEDLKPKKPPKVYVCKRCNAKGAHFFIDCPDYTCKLCGKKGHTPKDCSVYKRKPQNPSPCWFCLSNPKTVKHLILSVGNLLYLSLAKGSLIDTQNPKKATVPGGGHVLIIAIDHYSTFRDIPVEEQVDLVDELERYKSALRNLYSEYKAGMVLFETSSANNNKQQHCHIQVVPVPNKYGSNIIKQAFDNEATTVGFKFQQQTQSSSSPLPPHYFKVDFPDGTSYIHEIGANEKFDVQFGRKALAKLLNCTDRVDWRACEVPEDVERADSEKFRDSFRPFDPSVDMD